MIHARCSGASLEDRSETHDGGDGFDGGAHEGLGHNALHLDELDDKDVQESLIR